MPLKAKFEAEENEKEQEKAEKLQLIEDDLIRINTQKQAIESIKQEQAHTELSDWESMVSGKPNDELLRIYYRERFKYPPEMIVAVQSQLRKRRLIWVLVISMVLEVAVFFDRL